MRLGELQFLVLGAGIGAAVLAYGLGRMPRFKSHRGVLTTIALACAFASFLAFKLIDLAMKWPMGDSFSLALVGVGIACNSVLLLIFAMRMRRKTKATGERTAR